MTDQDITELLCHPRIREAIRRVARDEAWKMVVNRTEPKAPRGGVSYAKAAELLGYQLQTVRAYRSNGLLKGVSGRRGYVTITSLVALAKKRHITIVVP